MMAATTGGLRAEEVEWSPDANMDGQLFPSLIIATATVRPGDDEEEEENPEVLGDAYAAAGISITAPEDDAEITVTLKENALMNQSSWRGVLPTGGTEYYVAPRISYKFDQLRKVHQQVPLDITFRVTADGEELGEKSHTITVRSVNDCPFGVADSEETIEETDEEEEGETEEANEEEAAGYTDLGWMFAAYVNESSPIVDKILKEALATKIVNSFGGYQGDEANVLREVLAVWTALQNRGIKYSSITTTAGASELVYSQHVRFVDESLANEQANCVDGSVLLASVLRKIGLRTFLVTVPGHMYMGFYLNGKEGDRLALETTIIGARLDEKASMEVEALRDFEKTLDPKVAQGAGWKSFAAALQAGTANLAENAEKFEGENDPQHQITEIDEARKEGIMPISHLKSE